MPLIDELDIGGRILQKANARQVVCGDIGREVIDAFVDRPRDQGGHQRGCDSATVPLIHDRHRNVGAAGIVGVTDVTRDPHTSSVDLTDRDKRLVVVVVDVAEIPHVGCRQLGLVAEEPRAARRAAQPLEAIDQHRCVGAFDRSDRHLRPVPQRGPRGLARALTTVE